MSDVLTISEAMENAARLLRFAETETDLAKLREWAGLADSWISIANVLVNHEK